MSFEALEQRLRQRQRRTGERLAKTWEAEAKKEFKRNHRSRSSRLVNSIEGRSRVSGNAVIVEVRTGDLIQARTTNRGARPHIIRPRRRQFLAFHWDKATPSMRKLPDGRVLFRQVNHPGNTGSGWFDKAAETAHRRLLAQAWRSTR